MLTNETLRAIVHGKVLLGMNDVRPMAEDLLRLRAIRDAGDSEVSALAAELVNFISEQQDRIKVLIHADELARKLRDIAIARGQQLREAREETTEDMEAIACLSGDVERLTAERDEMVGLLKWWVDGKKTRYGFGLHLDAIATSPGESGDNARRILEIVEGK